MKKILFVCTHNRCRSILGEAISNHFSDNRIEVKSAGSHPADKVHPETLKQLQHNGIDTSGLFSKSWEDVEDFNPDLVITVCDQAANESCPVWMGDSLKLHWGLPDPTTAKTPEHLKDTFNHVIEKLKNRMRFVLSHNIGNIDATQFKSLFLQAGENI